MGLPVVTAGQNSPLVHGIGIHDPGYDLGVGAHIRCGDVFLRADEGADFGGVAAGHAPQLVLREQFGVNNHAAFGAAIGQIHQRTLPRHPHGQGAAFVQRHIRVVAQAAFGGAEGCVVLDAKTREHPNAFVVHHHRKVDDSAPLGEAAAVPACPDPGAWPRPPDLAGPGPPHRR